MAGRTSLFLLLAIVYTGHVMAWFDGGHMTVASLASERISDRTYHYLGKVMGYEPSCDSDGQCSNNNLQEAMIVDSIRMDLWKDVNRDFATAAYHFLDFPYFSEARHYLPDAGLRELGLNNPPPHTESRFKPPQLVYRLGIAFEKLKASAKKFLKSYIWYEKNNMKNPASDEFVENWHLLVHMIGDLGQPLHTTSRHCSSDGKRGREEYNDSGSNSFWFYSQSRPKIDPSIASITRSRSKKRFPPDTLHEGTWKKVDIALKGVPTVSGEGETSALGTLHQLWDASFSVTPYFNMLTNPDPLRPRFEQAKWVLAFARGTFANTEKPSCLRSGDCDFWNEVLKFIRRGHKRAMYASDAILLDSGGAYCSGHADVDKIFGIPSKESDLSSYLNTSRDYQALGITEAADLLALALEEIFRDAEEHAQEAVGHYNRKISERVSQSVLEERKERERKERERLAREEAERMERERKERERMEREEAERKERERKERERMEREEAERKERERKERERMEREEAERKERERMEREEAERKERERKERERMEREDAERKDRELMEREDAERKKEDASRLEAEGEASENADRTNIVGPVIKGSSETQARDIEGGASSSPQSPESLGPDGPPPISSVSPEHRPDGVDGGAELRDAVEVPSGVRMGGLRGPSADNPRPESVSGDSIPVPEMEPEPSDAEAIGIKPAGSEDIAPSGKEV